MLFFLVLLALVFYLFFFFNRNFGLIFICGNGCTGTSSGYGRVSIFLYRSDDVRSLETSLEDKYERRPSIDFFISSCFSQEKEINSFKRCPMHLCGLKRVSA